MNIHKFILEPYKTTKDKYNCPNCNKKTFTRYIDIQNNKHINDEVGKCNRLIKCKYHFTPKQYFKNNNYTPKTSNPIISKIKQQLKPNFINKNYLEKSINTNHTNYFIDFLTNIWDSEIAYLLAEKYRIGTSKHWDGATIFWQVDIKDKIRTGKIMLYNSSSGKRIKKPYNYINWIHKMTENNNFVLEQCLFGEHLLNEDKTKPVAIVESEKTAIMSSIFLPDFIWLACGSLNNLTYEKTKVLKGRNVVLFPDSGCYDLWNNKISSLTKLADFKTSTLIKEKATCYEKEKGYDILDYIMLDNVNYQNQLRI